MKSSPLFYFVQRRAIGVAVAVILVAALVLLIESAFVMSSGWAFGESILGGRIQPRTFGLAILMLSISATLFDRYADRTTAFRVAFGLCVLFFSILACWFSIEFTW